MFMVLSSRLLYPIMYIQYKEIKYAKNLKIQCFDSKCYRYKTSKVPSIRQCQRVLICTYIQNLKLKKFYM